MKFAWRNVLTDFAKANSEKIEDVESGIAEFEELLEQDAQAAQWDTDEDEIFH
jgi:hypothetical protein